jgi:hypothetical protein
VAVFGSECVDRVERARSRWAERGCARAAGVAVRRGTDAVASRGPGLALAVRRRGDGRGDPDLGPRWTDSRRRARGQSRSGATAIAPGAQHDEELAYQMVADVTQPERGVLPRGSVSVEARSGGLFQRLLLDDGWDLDEPWTPLQRDLAEPVEDCGVRIEVIGPERAHMRVAVQRAAFGRSTFTEERWHAMAAGAPYADAQCLVAYDDHGAAVAAATVWSAGSGRPGCSNRWACTATIAVTGTVRRSLSPRRPRYGKWGRRVRPCAPGAPTWALSPPIGPPASDSSLTCQTYTGAPRVRSRTESPRGRALIAFPDPQRDVGGL